MDEYDTNDSGRDAAADERAARFILYGDDLGTVGTNGDERATIFAADERAIYGD